MFQFPPLFIEKTNIHFINIFNLQTTLLFALANLDPLDQMIFFLPAFSLPKEGTSLKYEII